MNDIDLIKKLIRRHRAELTAVIGTFRAARRDGYPNQMVLRASSGAYTATVSRGEPDWLCVNDWRGASVATLY